MYDAKFSEQVEACASRLWWQLQKPYWAQGATMLKRFPAGWRQVVKEWAEAHNIAEQEGLWLATYIKWHYGSMDAVVLRVLMDEAVDAYKHRIFIFRSSSHI